MFAFAHVGWWEYRVSENATMGLMGNFQNIFGCKCLNVNV